MAPQDNSNALGAMIKGTSGNQFADRSAIVVSLVAALLQARIWFEYVESESNWSDSASRKLGEDPFAKAFGFTLQEAPLPLWPWAEPVASFLTRVQESLETQWR